MQFEEFDKKIKEAAEHHHPAYEEKAWNKMEKLLNKHLPVEKDNKRRIIFLVLFLLLGGAGIYLWIGKPWQAKKIVTDKVSVSSSKTDTQQNSTTPTTEKEETKKTISTATKNTTEKKDIKESNLRNRDTKNNKPVVDDNSLTTSLKFKNSKTGLTKNINTLKYSDNKLSKGIKLSETNVAGKNDNKPAGLSKDIRPDAADVVTAPTPVNKNNTGNANTNDLTAPKPTDNKIIGLYIDTASALQSTGIVKNGDENKNETVKKINTKNGKQNKTAFAITFSAGPDLSAAGLHKIGKATFSYGAGLSYRLNRFTLRSGFYVAKKVYSAGPDDYHPPKHYWTYYVDLDKVDADCKVYEIPVTISYNFLTGKKHNLFAAAGLSSYVMKKETYDYFYKDPITQMPENKSWTLQNGGNHLFSVLNLSAGYERKINKRLSLSAEPSLKIPMDGIGFGSIKLNSAGVLFTVSVQPFATKK